MAWTEVDSGALAPVTGLSATQITSGQLALARGGTAADLSATGGTSQVLQQASAGAVVTVGQLAASNLSNGVTGTGAVVLGGTWVDVAFNAGNFTTTGGGTWTVASGDQAMYAYREAGKLMTLNVNLSTTTIAGAPTELNIAIPNGGSVRSGTDLAIPIILLSGGVWTANTTWARIVSGGTTVRIQKFDGSAFANQVDGFYIYLSMSIPLA